jgi:O-acetyl-ADP-ribose deacetylase (regulator of RNase III)
MLSPTLRLSLYDGDITKSESPIVLPTNFALNLALAIGEDISMAAGESLQEACTKYVDKNGKLDIGECNVFPAGNLVCGKVIVVVEPVWCDSESEQWNWNDMHLTLNNVIQCADSMGFESIAIPAVSDNMFGFSHDVIAREMFNVFKKYAKERKTGSLKEIKIINKDEKLVKTFNAEFESNWPLSTTVKDKISVVENFSDTYTISSKTLSARVMLFGASLMSLGFKVGYSNSKEMTLNH